MKIFLLGFMGSGKTYLANQLSKKLELRFFDLDDQIINQEGKSINQLFLEKGEEAFRMIETEVLHLITESHGSFVMSVGGGTPCFFNNIDYMNQSGVTVWLNVSFDILSQRLIEGKEHRPLIKELTDEDLQSFIIKKFADRRMYYDQAEVHIDENTSLETVIEKIFHA